MAASAGGSVRTKFSLPPDLIREVDGVVADGKARSRNELVAGAVRHLLDRIQREADDAEFALMATDPDYQRDTLVIAGELEQAQWEALCAGEHPSIEVK
jgi:metal-responsive CopG/Arc/MetJ family transcriptional regulator